VVSIGYESIKTKNFKGKKILEIKTNILVKSKIFTATSLKYENIPKDI
jgi:hypothetical protein